MNVGATAASLALRQMRDAKTDRQARKIGDACLQDIVTRATDEEKTLATMALAATQAKVTDECAYRAQWVALQALCSAMPGSLVGVALQMMKQASRDEDRAALSAPLLHHVAAALVRDPSQRLVATTASHLAGLSLTWAAQAGIRARAMEMLEKPTSPLAEEVVAQVGQQAFGAGHTHEDRYRIGQAVLQQVADTTNDDTLKEFALQRAGAAQPPKSSWLNFIIEGLAPIAQPGHNRYTGPADACKEAVDALVDQTAALRERLAAERQTRQSEEVIRMAAALSPQTIQVEPHEVALGSVRVPRTQTATD